VDDVLIQCAGNSETLETDLTEWLTRLGTFDYQMLLISVRGDGGLNSKQRGRIADFWKKAGRKPPPTALLTDSAVARHVATAITWLLGAPLKAFETHEVAQAVSYLGAKATSAEISRTLNSLHAALEAKSKLRAG
jgi:hypothetical protein